jgi:hypothetical protein
VNTLRSGLPELPARVRSLPIDRRGYPVPWFVEWIDGEPDFRVMDSRKLALAHKQKLCWLCGQPRGKWLVFPIGPMCVVNRTNSEPPCHYDCALFSARACPFLTLPKARRREANLPDNVQHSAGLPIMRNPLAVALYVCSSYTPFRVGDDGVGNRGVLFELGEPKRIEWYAEGRPATRAEVLESIDTGLPLLREQAEAQSAAAVAALADYVMRAMPYLPAA